MASATTAQGILGMVLVLGCLNLPLLLDRPSEPRARPAPPVIEATSWQRPPHEESRRSRTAMPGPGRGVCKDLAPKWPCD